MAVLTLTLKNVSCYAEVDSTTVSTKDFSLDTANKNETINLQSEDYDSSKGSYLVHDYTLSMVEFKFQKKMYQPTEILARLQINRASGSDWYSIGRETIASAFKHKQVELVASQFDKDDDSKTDSIGTDFYVHAVVPCYKNKYMIVELKIYSLDKLLTLDKSCNTFVAKKLGSDILKTKLAEYKKPYDNNNTLPYKNQMQVLKFKRYNTVEHIFPYLVQYNESFYDMLIRTCNRWGEFVFWEDGNLHIGYNSEPTVYNEKNDTMEYKKIPDGYKTITYPNMDKTSGLVPDNSQFYFPVGADDSTIRDTNAQKSKWYAKGKIFAFANMKDVYAMQKFSQFLGTGKDLASFLVSTFVDDLVDLAKEESAVDDRNNNYNAKYFEKSDTDIEQYGKTTFMNYNKEAEKDDGMNEFTEIDTFYNDAKYKTIFGYELKAMENIVEIDYETSWPYQLKLGDIITVNSEDFLVIEMDCEKSSMTSPEFRIFAIGSPDGADGQFYPPMLSTGHVRYSGPQKATVKEASSEDPCDQNRVRVVYPWQMKPKENPTDADSWIGDLSPRIRIASSDGGANMASRFYVGDSVMIGYIDGNIERPYVLGSIPKIGTVMNNVHTMTTPGGHALNLTDGSGEGFIKFLTNMFTPLYNSISGWAPSSISGWVGKLLDSWDEDKYFEGGFSLTDRYGIYSISGSTDGRNVSIRSPWGDVMINAFTGINIMAPNGDINIVGKNVKIAAGNNLTLTSGTNIMNLVTNDKGNNQYVYWDKEKIISAVAEKLVQKNLQIVDVKMLRSVVEIIMRPVEGTLTLKSMRFMKLETGTKHKCAFPKNAYKKVGDEGDPGENAIGTAIDQKKSNRNTLNAENFALIKRTVNGMAAFANKLVEDFEKRCNDMVDQRNKFENAIKILKLLANRDAAVCSDFNALKTDFWDSNAYAVWTADKLGFVEDNVGIIKDGDNDENIIGYIRGGQFDTGGMTPNQKKNEALRVCSLRRIHRNKVLKEANKLRKMIWDFVKFDVDDNIIKKYFKSYKYPTDYQNKLKNSSNKAHCGYAVIYRTFTEQDKCLQDPFKVTNLSKKYVRRLMIYNVLQEIGFTDDTRLDIMNNPAPNIEGQSPTGLYSLVNDTYWRQYVGSLSGVPIVNKQMSGTLLDKVTDTVKKASGISDADALIQDWGEHNIWGESDKGSLLIATNGDTYSLTGNMITKVVPAQPTLKSFKSDDTDWYQYDKDKLVGFVIGLRRDLLKQ